MWFWNGRVRSDVTLLEPGGGGGGRCCSPPRVWLFHCGCPSSYNPCGSWLMTAGPISSLSGDKGRAAAELRFSWDELRKRRWPRDLWPPHYMKCQQSYWSSYTRIHSSFIMYQSSTNLCICLQAHDNEKDVSLCVHVHVCVCVFVHVISCQWNPSLWEEQRTWKFHR